MPVQERAIETRRRILRAAAEVFASAGYEAATIADVLGRSGVTKGALYFHFASKEDLADAVMAEQRGWLDERPVDFDAPLQFLIDLSYEFCRAMQEDAVVQASIRLTVERATYLGTSEGLYAGWVDHTRVVFEAAKRLGQLGEGWRSPDLARLIIGCMTGMQMASAAESGTEDLLARVHVFWRAVVPTVVTPEIAAGLRLKAPRRRVAARQ